ncbi:phosphoribosylaminoimidazolecarboxamide formyltransferase [Microlunatus soli]|uniref:Phosphoribosylaminoimidazolecarboxamide formyltransferase / IMP cyclohydrolase n=1 Tax=Microlunatus soli TaxID=630515 RepID=A0A1H1QVD3_9ACTN|nr:phosphoribosylaminoimidazolecarboxamide formyltransferase [Microlunatus soli]SDS27315.1 phosphoribosylaminoimidazolecarboxamide formyltransferase / IMP cyclohydrolase [Microlunatus soli]
MDLRYGMNPNQPHARIEPVGDKLPFEVLSGSPGFINVLDALNAWQLVAEAAAATQKIAATSFKHVSPAGVAVEGEVPPFLLDVLRVQHADLSPAAAAYLRSRSSDPRASYGDFIAISGQVDESCAQLIKKVVSDGIIAPSYTPQALEILKAKRKGSYLVLQADPDYRSPATETREIFGVRLVQDADSTPLTIDSELSDVVTGSVDAAAKEDLILGLIALKYTQSNSVAYSRNGQVIAIGAGQQSRIACTQLAGEKLATWLWIQHERIREVAGAKKGQDRLNLLYALALGDAAGAGELIKDALTDDERAAILAEATGISFTSDGFLPFSDNVEEAHKYGVSTIAAPTGSVRDDVVFDRCQELDISFVRTPRRYFHH